VIKNLELLLLAHTKRCKMDAVQCTIRYI